MQTANFYLWQIGRRPFVAYAAGERAGRLRALALFPCPSLKRRLLLRAIQLAVILGIDGFFARRTDRHDSLPASQDLDVLLDELRKHGGGTSLDWLLIWPAQPERRRWYLAFRDLTRSLAGIVKVGHGSFNQRQLHNEARKLTELASLEGINHPFTIPAVLFECALDRDRTALALRGFPVPTVCLSNHLAVLHGAKAVLHFAALPVPATRMPLRQTDWFTLLREKMPDNSVVRRIRESADTPIDVGWAHGDLGPGNMILDHRGDMFLFDWENATAQAPVMTDRVALWLACRQRETLRNPAVSIKAFRNDFEKESEDRLLLALAFLSAHGNIAAHRLLENWAQVETLKR